MGPHIPRAALARLLRDTEGLQALALAPCHEWLSDADLLPVLARNPQLRSVALAGCGQLSRRALGALAEGCPRLRRLSLAHCDWVDGLALRGLADRCPALEELDLTACRQLKDEAIVYLARRRGAGLRSLSLAVNANVGDTAVQELARNCPRLEHLDLTGCLRVGSDGVRCQGQGGEVGGLQLGKGTPSVHRQAARIIRAVEPTLKTCTSVHTLEDFRVGLASLQQGGNFYLGTPGEQVPSYRVRKPRIPGDLER